MPLPMIQALFRWQVKTLCHMFAGGWIVYDFNGREVFGVVNAGGKVGTFKPVNLICV